jgi:UDP-GlcNAc:undecaprenyl-phosphate/decaprenyl-phosphate GlcNAc-1-phosphate transferase
MRTYVGLFVIAALVTVLVTPRIAALGQRLNAYGGKRGRDGRRIPRLGGLAIFLASLLAWALLLLIPNAVRTLFVAHLSVVALIFVPAALILVLGMIDDLVGIAPWQKLAVEVLAAGIIWWSGFRIGKIPFLGYGIHSVVSLLITVLWIVAVTNSLNLIDGLDGLAAGISLFVTLTMFFVSLLQQNVFACVLSITLAGALLGFLRYNFAPAKIFLGDTGSLFLGFLLSVLAIQTSQKSSTLLAIVVPFVAFGLPLLDTTLSVVRRFLSGRPVFVPDLDHIHHRLLQKGLTPRVAVLLLYGVGALFSLGSLLILSSTANIVALVAVLAGVFAWFLTSQLQYEEISELNVYVARAMNSQRRVLANQIRIRKAAHELETSASLEEGWNILTATLDALDFDRAVCHIGAWPGAVPPALAPWERPGSAQAGQSWNASIPLRSDDDKAFGELRLARALGKDRLLFQFSSLLDTLIPPFERQFRRVYAAAATKAQAQAKAADAERAGARAPSDRLATATEE